MKERIPLFVLVLLLAVFVLTQQGLLIGLDNQSPYFGFDPLINTTSTTRDYFNVGPLQFLWWLYLLAAINVPAVFISKIWIVFYLAIGTFGFYNIVKSINTTKETTEKGKPIASLSYIIALLSSTVLLWLLSAPSLTYLGLFAVAPYLIQLISTKQIRYTFLQWCFALLILLPILLSTMVNVVAVLAVFGSVVIISILLYSQTVKVIIMRLSTIALVLLIALQFGMISMRVNKFIVTHLIEHAEVISSHPFTSEVTVNSIKVEKDTASITNAARYSLGWQHIIFPDGSSVFPFEFIRSNVYFVSLAVALVLLTVYVAIGHKRKEHSILLYMWAITALLLSTFGIVVIQQIPLIKDMLRMGSTKLWLLLFFPYIVLTTYAIQQILESKVIYKILGLTSYAVIIISIFSSGVFARNINTTIPSEYFDLNQVITKQSELYIYPEPHMLYFRQYRWGYYGSDILGYILKSGTIYDTTSLGYDYLKYQSTKNELMSCNTTTLKDVYVLVDHSTTNPDTAQTDKLTACLSMEEIASISQENQYFTLYQLR